MTADDDRPRKPGRNKHNGLVGGADRRRSVRFALGGGEGWLSTVPKHGVVDMSGSGVGLKSRYPVRAGELVRVSLRGGPSADALVVYCRLGDTPDHQLIPEFRLGCRFVSREEATALNERIEYELASMMG